MNKHNAATHYEGRLKVGDDKYIYDPVVRNHLLRYIKNRKCLDLGCGSGYYLKMMGIDSTGYDASIANIEYGKSNGLDIQLTNLDEWTGTKGYELVFASHIIEHLLSPVKFLESCKASLEKEGILIIGVPTENSIDRLLYGYGFNEDVRHFYSFSPKNLQYLIERSGFKIIDRYVSYTLMGTLKSDVIEKTLQKIVPFRLGTFMSKGFYFVCKSQ